MKLWRSPTLPSHGRRSVHQEVGIPIVSGVPNGKVTARFVHHVIGRYRRLGVTMCCVLSDNGPEYIAKTFTDALAAKQLTHQRIPPRSPNYNAACERFQGTALQECRRQSTVRTSSYQRSERRWLSA